MAEYSNILRKGLAANYYGIENKDPYALYFTTDTHQLFLGDQLMSAAIEVVSTRPNSPKLSVPYYCEDTGSLDAYINNKWVVLVKGTVVVIDDKSTDETIPTTKAVYDLVKDLTADTSKEIIDARGEYNTLADRLNGIDDKLDNWGRF